MLQWTMACMYLFELWFSPDMCPGVGLLDHMVALFLVFWGISILFSLEAVPIYIPNNRVGGFPFFRMRIFLAKHRSSLGNHLPCNLVHGEFQCQDSTSFYFLFSSSLPSLSSFFLSFLPPFLHTSFSFYILVCISFCESMK